VPYRVLTGLSYPPDKRAEIGDVVDDLPSKSIKWLLTRGHIEEIAGKDSSPKFSPVSILKPEYVEKDGE
jgi:hypothetical protein